MTKHSLNEVIGKLRHWNNWYRGSTAATDDESEEGASSGVNVCGYLRDESGWGAAGRGYVRALRSLNVPLALNDISELSSNRSQDRTLHSFDNLHPFDVNLICVDAGQHFALMRKVGEEFFENRYNIGAWAWELPRFPERWFDRFAYYDEIWVGTSFIANTLSGISPVPVVRVPPVLTRRELGSREDGRRRLNVEDEEFVYLFIFDFHSHLQRKNPLALVDAFKSAFEPSSSARLIVKCVNASSDPEGFEALNRRAAGHRVFVFDGYWSSQEMSDLMEACDAYVSLHRSEGTGLTISDAMALAKPVIATGWSGNMDFMNVSNSFPVRFEMVEIAENVGPYEAGQIWAEPSVEHAAQLMRHVFEHRDEARAMGLRAQRDIETNFSEEVVADLIRQRLEAVAVRRRLPAFRQQLRSFYQSYRQLVGEIREIARSIVPEHARVIVVSKGDEELLKLEGREAWHFPQTDEGVYAGHYPTDDAAAIEHLEALRRKGGQFLLIPGTARWWLELYAGFGQHLDARHRRLWDDERCIIYELAG